jgi:predicted enzyme related to lactoylglutathione lyase
MLKDAHTHTTLPAMDIERAKRFYAEKLGLTPTLEHEAAIQYFGQDARFVLYPTPNPARGGHTQMGFTVDDLKAEVADLRSRGVVFEEYDYPNLKTEDGVAKTPAGWAAWFKDSEGNMIGLVQFS